jgi:hypothetical protein
MRMHSIVNSPWFAKTSVILFLNKNDLFLEKIQKIGLKRPEFQWFMDYEGGNDADKAFECVALLVGAALVGAGGKERGGAEGQS